MNSWPGPENSWEGVDAYFTSANSEGTLIFWTLVVIALCIFATFAAANVANIHKAITTRVQKIRVPSLLADVK